MRRLTSGLFLAWLLLGAASAGAATPEVARTIFAGSIREVPMVASGGRRTATVTRMVLSPAESAATLPFEVGLLMRNFADLQARIARGEVVSDAEKARRYFPLAADHDRIVAWLRGQGLEVTRTDANHLGIFGRGSVDAVSRAFRVSFARVTALDGGEYTSAVTAPSLPADLSPLVAGVHGLQPHIRRRPLSTPRSLHPNLNLGGYTPAQVEAAYNANTLPATTTGANQTIAIYALGYPRTSDLTTFWTTVGVAQTAAHVHNVDVAGGPGAAPSNDILEEVTLDVEWAGAIAPGAAIRIYGADEADPADNDEILQQVYADLPGNPTLHVLSISIGGNELDVPKDFLEIEAQYMANLASAGVTVLVASGDTGASSNGVVQTSYPTSDPDVTGVGGTTLTLTSTGAVQSETTWAGSGGGISVAFDRPSWQVGTGVPSGTMRLVPDVAAAADPNAGALYVFQGTSTAIGGTSWSAPTWAGFCALINQQTGSTLGFLNPKIYPQMGVVTRDITTGGNGAYNAGAGYDLCTGIGVPNVAALATAAAAFTTATAANVPGQTGNQFVTIGQPATFFVVGDGASPLAYQWQKKPSGGGTWSSLSDSAGFGGTLTNTLVVNATTVAMTGDSYQCVVTNGTGSATSTPATLTVSPVGVTTLAGWPGSAGRQNGTGRAARFGEPGSIRTDSQGNVYVGDTNNFTVRKITPAGVVTTVAGIAGTSGSTDGPVATALFNAIGGVAIDTDGTLYVADSANYTVRKVTPGGVVSTLAGVAGTRGDVDGTGSQARFYDPQNLAIDAFGHIYVADGMGNVVRKVTTAGVVTTFAGSGAAGSTDGSGTAAKFNDPTGISVDAAGNVYVADYGNDTIRKITPAGVVTTLAGAAGQTGSVDGSGAAATFNGPAGVGADGFGNVYVADLGDFTVRKVDATGFVTTVAGVSGSLGGTDGLPGNARFNAAGDVSVDNSGIVYLADSGNSTIRRIIPGLDSIPFFVHQPANQAAHVGDRVVIFAGIAGTAPFVYQWSFNGTAIAGATTPYYLLTSAQQSDSGTYAVTVSNLDGTATSAGAALTVTVPPVPVGDPQISVEPVGGALSGGSDALSVTVTGNGPFTYQWFLNGAAIAGATAPTYTATAAGSYTVAVTNSAATVVSSPAVVTTASRLINISTRAEVGTGAGVTIAGFSISGPAGVAKQVLIRGVGPTLVNFSITGFLATPTLTLFNAASTAIDTDTGWNHNAEVSPDEIASLAASVGAFPLNSGSADSVLVESLTPGNYSVQLSGVGATTGVGLIEVYETNTAAAARLVNISTRAQVGTGANVLIAGFVVRGTQPVKVLVRGVGPALTGFGVTGALAQPVLAVFDSTGTQIAADTGWTTSSNPTEITAVSASVGAFAFGTGSADSALVLTLAPGTYSAQVSGAAGTTGIALVEVYLAP